MASLTTIFITGASRGLGYQVSKELVARPNIHLIVSCRGLWTNKSEADALATFKSVLHKDSKLDALDEVDLTNDDALKKSIDKVADITGNSLDILINNAAIFSFFDAFKEGASKKKISVREEWTRDFNTNLFGTVVLTGLAIPLLKESAKKASSSLEKKPLIFNVTSDLGSMTFRGDPSYSGYGFDTASYPCTKSALNAYTVYLSVTHKDIKTVSWNPGYAATAINNFSGPEDPVVVGEHFADAVLNQNFKSGTFADVKGGTLPW